MKNTAILQSVIFGIGMVAFMAVQGPVSKGQETSSATLARRIGTIKAITGNSMTLTPDSGPDVTVAVQSDARILRIAPGAKDLKDATPVPLHDLQVGDRVRVRGKATNDPNWISALEIIVMARTDLEAHRQ